MIELGQNAGVFQFTIISLAMVLSAGVAIFPPARDFRVFLGAVMMSGAWAATIVLPTLSNHWSVAAGLFLLNFAYIAVFYSFSRARENEPPDLVKERNWAGYVAFTLCILTAAKVAHALSTVDFALRPFAIVVLGLIGLIIFWGFARGFGLRVASLFALAMAVICIAGINLFHTTSTALTAIIFGIIFWRSIQGLRQNLAAWSSDK